MATLYNEAGEAKEMDGPDAREHLETGQWFTSAPALATPAPVEAAPFAPFTPKPKGAR